MEYEDKITKIKDALSKLDIGSGFNQKTKCNKFGHESTVDDYCMMIKDEFSVCIECMLKMFKATCGEMIEVEE